MSQIPIPAPLVLHFAEQCDRGKVRDENQDSILRAKIPLGELLIVADGIGGYKGGAVASRMVVENFRAHLQALPPDYPPVRAIAEAAARTNANIIAAARAPGSRYNRMGSTVVMALVQRGAAGFHAWIGHIGDSRAYLVRDGRLIRLTNDHSAVQALLNRNLITPEEAVNHPDSSVLTRSLGHQPEVQIDVDKHDFAVGDTLLLCSDGLWGYVSEQEIQRVAANSEITVETAARALLGLALAQGGHDNIAIEMARLLPAPPAPPPGRRTRIGFMEILALCLLAFAGLGAFAYFAARGHWLQDLVHLRHLSSATNGGAASEPASPLTIAVVQGPGAEPFDLSELSAPGWQRVEVAGENRVTCQDRAASVHKVTVYYNNRRDIEQAVANHASIRRHAAEWDKRKMDPQDPIKDECGPFDVIVLVPSQKSQAQASPAVQPKPVRQPKPQVPPKPEVPAQPRGSAQP